MAKFSPTEAVFAGFRFARERPAVLLIWAAFLLVVIAVATLALFDLGGDQMTALMAASQQPTFDMAQLTKLSEGVEPASSFAMLLMIVFGSVLATAILRVQTEPGQHPWGGLKLGGDELRVLGANLAVVLTLFFAWILVALAADAAAEAGIPAAPILVLGALLVLALHVRLSLTPVVAMTEKKISLLRSWALTGKGFWRLLGAYALLTGFALVLLVLIAIVFSALMAAVTAAGGGGNPVTIMMTGAYGGLNPLSVAVYMLMNLAQVWLAMLILAVGLRIGVDAYRAFKVDTPAA
jgi:hypothetical protein